MDFNAYNTKKQVVTQALGTIESTLDNLGADYSIPKTEISTLKKRLSDDSFKVVVMGQFKVGKSTFINALLGGGDVLPAYSTPTTAIINEVKYAPEKKAIVYFKNPIPKDAVINNDQVKQHIRKFNGKDVAPIEVPYDEIENYVVIDTEAESEYAESQYKAVVETPYEKAELYWPLELCKQGVEIIDTPGLNENESRTKVTKDYLSNADAILFVMSCLAPCAQNEMSVIDNDIIDSGHQYIFFIGNRINQISPRDRERQKQYMSAKLKNKTKFGEKGIFFVNAEAAKDGRAANNEELINESGIREIEALLHDFLVNQRGAIKLSQPIMKSLYVIDKIIKENIPNEQRMLNSSIEELEKRYRSELPNIEHVRREKDQLKKGLVNRVEWISGEVNNKIEAALNDIEHNLKQWVDKIQCDTQIDIREKKTIEAYSQEMITKLQEKIQEELRSWKNEKIVPFITARLNEMSEEYSYKIENIFLNIDNIKLHMSGDTEIKTAGKGEKIAATVAGFFTGGLGGGIAGGVMGFSKEFVGTIVAQIASLVTLLLVGVTNPVTFIVSTLIIALIGMGRMQDRIENKVREEIVQETTKQLQKQKNSIVDNATKMVQQNLMKGTEQLDQRIAAELEAIETHLENVKQTKLRGQQQAMERNNQLRQSTEIFTTTMKQLDQELRSLKN